MEEQQYLDLLQRILDTGCRKPTRTGTDCISVTGAVMRFSLTRADGTTVLPLLTTKRVPFRLVAAELLWFLSGCTDAHVLDAQGVRIWNPNSSTEYLRSRGLDYVDGDLGPIYGYQWRSWNAPYTPIDRSATRAAPSAGVDQIQQVVSSIKRDPWSRRHVVSAWNPQQIPEMALPPCHILFQFTVRSYDDASSYGDASPDPYWLDCCLYQRSADVPLGIPFNIASYALLLHIVARATGLHAGEFVHFIADAHVYSNQVDGVLKQLVRSPGSWPEIVFSDRNADNDVFGWTLDDFTIADYAPQSRIQFPFST